MLNNIQLVAWTDFDNSGDRVRCAATRKSEDESWFIVGSNLEYTTEHLLMILSDATDVYTEEFSLTLADVLKGSKVFYFTVRGQRLLAYESRDAWRVLNSYYSSLNHLENTIAGFDLSTVEPLVTRG